MSLSGGLVVAELPVDRSDGVIEFVLSGEGLQFLLLEEQPREAEGGAAGDVHGTDDVHGIFEAAGYLEGTREQDTQGDDLVFDAGGVEGIELGWSKLELASGKEVETGGMLVVGVAARSFTLKRSWGGPAQTGDEAGGMPWTEPAVAEHAAQVDDIMAGFLQGFTTEEDLEGGSAGTSLETEDGSGWRRQA
jgi:hypothetical protein